MNLNGTGPYAAASSADGITPYVLFLVAIVILAIICMPKLIEAANVPPPAKPPDPIERQFPFSVTAGVVTIEEFVIVGMQPPASEKSVETEVQMRVEQATREWVMFFLKSDEPFGHDTHRSLAKWVRNAVDQGLEISCSERDRYRDPPHDKWPGYRRAYGAWRPGAIWIKEVIVRNLPEIQRPAKPYVPPTAMERLAALVKVKEEQGAIDGIHELFDDDAVKRELLDPERAQKLREEGLTV